VWQWARGVKPVPVPRCCPIEIATGGDVMRWDLRPNDWHAIWPELRKHKNAPALKVAANA
jgi:DNA-binding transcriptional regulator YdaS (Cro superfamily)